MDSWSFYLVILIAIAIGWWLGRREVLGSRKDEDPRHSRDYYRGLNYLLNDQPDQAISTFIDSLEVNNHTIETHLALGSLLRKRGELDRAVSVHQNLLTGVRSNPDLTEEVQLELARDYLLAGLLDRAEKLLSSLIEGGANTRIAGLRMLLEIYQQEHEWQKAIDVVSMLGIDDAAHYKVTLSHLNCELAEDSLHRQDYSVTRDYLSQALVTDSNCVRASLMLGQLMFDEGDFKSAIKILESIRIQNPRLVSESCDLLAECYRESGLPRSNYQEYLVKCLEVEPAITIVLALARSIREHEGDEAMVRLIAQHLKKNPTLKGLTQLIDLHIDNTDGIAKENLSILRSFTEALIAGKPSYQCVECGFSGKKLHWMCPSCKGWGSVSPIYGLEGE